MKKYVHILIHPGRYFVSYFILMLCGLHGYAQIRYVKPVASGLGNGSSWAHASSDLQAMINASVAGEDIWVAAGTYKPNRRADATGIITINDRDNAFVLKNGVRIFGGFNGTETLTSQRNFATNITILSGDLGTAASYTDNCYHVVVSAGTVTGTALNGFHIRYGNANGSGTITVNAISIGRGSGAGIRLNSSSPTISNCIFAANITTNNGGGMVCDGSAPVITNCLFSGNTAVDAGGLYNVNASVPQIVNCSFSGNNATATGGAIRNSADSDPAISNCILWGNLAAGIANAIFNSDAASVPLVNYSIVEGGYTGTKNQNTDPLFVSPVAATLAPTFSGDYRLQLCSPGINGGLNSYVPGSINNDLDYNPRIHYGKVDCGVYEKPLTLAVPNGSGVVFVDSTKNGNGSSWGNAVKELADALIAAKYNSSITQIWVAKGTYYPKYEADDDASLACSISNRNNGFVTVPNVPIYGGFSGNETLLSQRNAFTNVVKLSGNIGAPGSASDNSYHVLINAGNANCTLDGINIVEGNANGVVFITPSISVNGFTVSPRRGGGMFNISSGLSIFQCTVENNFAGLTGGGIYDSLSWYISNLGLRVRNNQCAGDGGGWYSSNSEFTFFSGEISGNESGADGGGIYLTPSSYLMNITGCSILSNMAQGKGGGICTYSTSSSQLKMCRVSGNESVSYGGGLFTNGSPDFVIKSSLISGNLSDQGAAIWHAYTTFTHTNITVTGNRATTRAGAFGLGVSNGAIRNAIVYGNIALNAGTEAVYISASTLIQNKSIIQGGFDGAIDEDPLFVAPESAAAAPTSNGNYRIQKCSPALNGGYNGYLDGTDMADLDFQTRLQQLTVDIGAYELNITFAVPGSGGIIYVDSSKAGNGSNWANATPSLSDALQAAKFNSSVTQIWVAKGTYYPVYDARDNTSLACKNTNRSNSFVLVNNVIVYGGFNGTETLLSQRDVVINKTILSGDIGTIGFQDDNSYHVVVSAGNIGTAELNGFSIINGRGLQSGVALTSVNGVGVYFQHGAGINCAFSSPLISKCRFENNIVSNVGEGGGGAIYISTNSNPVISDCSFRDNVAGLSGGAIFTISQNNISVSNCDFYKNKATINGGGAVYVSINGRISIDQSTFTENEGQFGGAILNSLNVITKVNRSVFTLCDADYGGAIYTNDNSMLEVDSSSFLQNTGIYGAAIHFDNNADFTASSCTFSENNASGPGGAIFTGSNIDANLTDCIFSANNADNGHTVWVDNNSDFSFVRCRFENNGISNPGGCTVFIGGSTSIFENCWIKGNTADNSHLLNSIASNVQLINTEITGNKVNNDYSIIGITGGVFTSSNCTVSGNKKNFPGIGSILRGQSSTNIFINNSIIWGNESNLTGSSPFSLSAASITTSNSIIQGGYAGTNILNTDPRFILPELAANAPIVAGNYRLKPCSPAINSGDNALIPSGITVDLDSMNRINIVNVDRGAYERRLPVPDINGIVYVDSSKANNEGDGSSWANAASELADALKAAKTDNAIKEVWVAKGTYIPLYRADDNGTSFACSLTDRDNTFRIQPNVKVYGGFAGGETDTTGRDLIINETVLSGDIGIIGNHADNAYHVAFAAGNVGSAAIDGFTITRGNANVNLNYNIDGNLVYRSKGGGMQLISASPLLSQCNLKYNYALQDGGAMYLNNSNANVKNSAFVLNEADDKGAAVTAEYSPALFSDNLFSENKVLNAVGLQGGGAIYGYESGMTFRKCNFISNLVLGSGQGGGMFLLGNPKTTISACIFSGNKAGGEGGALYTNNTTSDIINTAIHGNRSDADGGAIYNHFFTTCNIKNCTIASNRAAGQGGGIVFASTGNISNSIIYNNLAPSFTNIWDFTIPTVSHSIIQGGYAGTNNLDLAPLFINQQTAASAPNILGNYRLQACSPALNAGNNALVPSGINNDLDSVSRIRFDQVDMGAFEKQDIDLANTTWKGINTNWNDKINWCGGYIPYDTTNVTVPLTLNNPVIQAGYDNEAKNLTLASNTAFDIANTGKFTINGTYTNNGCTITNHGKWVMAGSSPAQLFPGTFGNINAMNHLEINNPSGIVLNKTFYITGSLIPTAGIINVNARIILSSSDTATASVDIIQPGASIVYSGPGNFVVERFINTGTSPGQHTKTWQFLSTPTTGQSIYQAWQENGSAPAGYGTWITGTGSGFDAATALPSLKFFNEAAVNWTAVTNTGNSLVNKLGYMLFVRGDRTVNTFNGTPNNTILRSTGQIFTPTNPPPSVAVSANKFQSFGNPYASRIEFNRVYNTSTGINDVFYVWDPKLAGSYNVGGYQTITGITGYIPTVGTPPAGNAATDYYPAGLPSPYIESGQAVFVKGNATGGNINFNEQVKVSGSRLVNRPVNPNNPVTRRQFLFTSLFTNTGVIADGNIIAFEKGFGNDVNGLDAEKIMNGGENFGLKRDGKVLSVEAHEPANQTDTIFYDMGNLRKQPYQLRFAPVNMGSVNIQPYLIDRFRNTETQLSVTDSTMVDFEVSTNVRSAASDRFYIVFKRKGKQQFVHMDIKGMRQVETVPDSGINVTGLHDPGIMVYPNPVSGRIIQLWYKAMPEGVYAIKLFSASGQLVFEDKMKHEGGSAARKLCLSAAIPSGIYLLDIIAGNGEKYSFSLQL